MNIEISFPLNSLKYIYKYCPLSGRRCYVHFSYFWEINTFKDLQPPENSGLQYKPLVLILNIVYGCIVSNETNFKQFSLEIKSNSPFLEITLLPYGKFSIPLDEKCHISHSTFCTQWNLSHVLIVKVLFDKWQLLLKLSYILSLKKNVLHVPVVLCALHEPNYNLKKHKCGYRHLAKPLLCICFKLFLLGFTSVYSITE